MRDLGFRRIANVDNADDLADVMRGRQFELMVFAADGLDAGPSDMVRQARRYDGSSDPYTPMIVVSWSGASEKARDALNSGTDQFLMWPFSTEQLGARVAALIHARKPFVETEDYLGPDRRDRKGRSVGRDTVEVPNALRARVERRPDLAPSEDALQAARGSLERIKIGNVAQRIGTIAKVLRQRADDVRFLETRAPREFAAIQKSLSVIRKSLEVTELDHLQSFCDSVERVVLQLSRSAPELDPKGYALLEQTALALRVAMEVDEDTANAAVRLSGEVAEAF
ncbi:MAG: hypothetical protein QF384_13920 [Alphaproteobacteria bacterium]|nr:hypothetical protein [Alphaproteobacteria bacterium]